jgi:hypothetical protein
MTRGRNVDLASGERRDGRGVPAPGKMSPPKATADLSPEDLRPPPELHTRLSHGQATSGIVWPGPSPGKSSPRVAQRAATTAGSGLEVCCFASFRAASNLGRFSPVTAWPTLPRHRISDGLGRSFPVRRGTRGSRPTVRGSPRRDDRPPPRHAKRPRCREGRVRQIPCRTAAHH